MDLKSKIFTFDKKMISKDLTKINNSEDVKLDKVMKNLKCMHGIDENLIPTFKFFTFKVSYIKDLTNKNDQLMLCFQDISSKILADTSKAEGELLSLINSTISHEMRNPLNSVIN